MIVKFYPSNLNIKVSAIVFIFFLLAAVQINAQSIYRAYGSNCVGGMNYYAFMGSCSNISWWVSSGGTIIGSSTSSSVQVRWDSPTSNAYVVANYSGCSGGSGGSVSSAPIVISVIVTPSVSISANTTSFCGSESGNVTFTATPVNGGNSRTYTWRVNGSTVQTTTTNTFSMPKSSFSNGDVVQAIMYISGSCLTTTSPASNNITMNVAQPTVPTATLTGPQSICSGSTSGVTFSVAVNNGSNPTYTWLKNGFPVSDRMSGPPPYVYIPQNPLNNGDKIKCQVSFSGTSCLSTNTIESNEYTVSLTSQTSPYVSIQIPTIYFCSGNQISLTASSPYITGNSTYSWKLNGSQFSTSSTASLPVTTESSMPNAFSPGDVITVTVGGLSGHCLSSSTATGSTSGIPFVINNTVTPSVSMNASATTICGSESGNIIFTATPTNGGSNPAYAWQINGNTITTGVSNTFTRAKSSLNHNDVIRVVMTTNVACATQATATSNSITMSVYQPDPLEVYIFNPSPICAQTPWTFDAGLSISDEDATYYTWYKNNVVVKEGLGYDVAGFYNPGTLANGDKIQCKVTYTGNDCVSGSPAWSDLITLSVKPRTEPYVVIDIPSGNGTYCEGESITFEAIGSNLSNYQWKLNNTPVGTNNRFLTTNQFTNGSTLTVTANASGTCLTGNIATGDVSDLGITIKPLPNASINPSGIRTICSDCIMNVSAGPVGTGYSYEWFKNNESMHRGGVPTTLPDKFISTEGVYRIRVTRDGCSKMTPDSLKIIVNVKPVVDAGPDKVLIIPQRSTQLTGTASDPDGTIESYKWTKVTGPLGGFLGYSASSKFTMTNLSEGTYVFRLTVKDNFGEEAFDEVSVTVQNPPNNYNYVRETTVLVEGQSDTTAVHSLAVGEKSVTTNYFDGMGRLMQSVIMRGSPSMKDIVQPVVYDAVGREHRRYLPFTAEDNGYFKPVTFDANGNYTGIAANFYSNNPEGRIAQDERPFSETVFEPSPLNRSHKEFGPGEDWFANSKYIEHGYVTNVDGSMTGKEKIIAWKVDATGMPVRNTNVIGTSSSPGYYPSGALQVKRTIDENGHEVREYTDKLGRLILKKEYVFGNILDLNHHYNWIQTYYIYDQFGNLRFVLQPKLMREKLAASTSLNPDTTDLAALAFQYKYDEKNRLVEKRIPGSLPVYMVYDERDRIVLTQDGNQRRKTNREWTFTKYDAMNRPVLSGIYINNSNRESMQIYVNNFYKNLNSSNAWYETYDGASGDVLGFDNKSFPHVMETDCFTATYYDQYDTFIAPSGYSYSYESLPSQDSINNPSIKGLVAGNLIKNFGNNSWLRSVNYYDDKYRLIQVISDHHKGKLITSNVIDFADRTTMSIRTYVVDGVTTSIRETFEYDSAGRLTTTKHSVNGAGDVMISKLEYNEIGQFVDKKLHNTNNGTNFAQSVDFLYNIRGWITKMNDPNSVYIAPDDPTQDYFGMELAYNKPLNGTTSTNIYNGNISAIQWSIGGNGDAKRQAYSYDYDPLNRLLNANHSTYKGGNWDNENDAYSENITEYDHNGNIIRLSRKGYNGAWIDDIKYEYTGRSNKLSYVRDYKDPLRGFIDGNGGVNQDYDYDKNGNIILDKNKGILAIGDIKYNHLNLPVEVIKGNERIKYIYDATGKKLAVEVYNGTNPAKHTDYIGELLYESNQLKFINHSEGRLLPDGSNWEYQYHLKDHLGNVRVTFTTKPQSTDSKTATFEVGTQTDEENYFENYSSTVFDLMDHTDTEKVYEKAQWLNGGVNGRVGLAKSYSVMPGDKISITAYAKYRNLSENPNTTALITSLASAFGVSSSSSGEELKLYNGLNTFALTVPEGDHDAYDEYDEEEDENAPMAFVTILFFDRDYNLLDAAWEKITTEGEQIDEEDKEPHDELSVSAVAKDPGYAYIFVSNEHPYYVDVYFDDVTISHTPSQIIGFWDYYAFGGLYSIGNREGELDQKYLYNGKELQNDLNLGWFDFGARMYMPDVGIWMGTDPMAKEMPSWSPYVFVLNNPVNFNDPTGEWPNPVKLLYDAFFRTFTRNTTVDFIKTATANNYFRQNNSTYARLGRIFEDAVIRSMGEEKNTKRFRPTLTSPKYIVPDVVGSTGLRVDPKTRLMFPGASFVDVKFKSLVELNDKYNPMQMTTMIDALSNMRGGFVNGKWDPNLKASDHGMAVLTLITPQNGVISPDLIEYATSKNVKVFQRFTEQDEEDPSRIRVGPVSVPLNFFPINNGIIQPFKAPGESVEVNWNVR